MRYKRLSVSGFTMIELMLVLVLVGIIASVSAPAMGRLYRAAASDASARSTAAILNLAKVSALKERANCIIRIDEAGKSMRLYTVSENEASPYGGSDGRLNLARGTYISAVYQGEEAVNLPYDIEVRPGYAPESVRIVLKGMDGDLSSVVFQAGGGRVEIQ